MTGDPMDAIEAVNAMRNLASMIRALYTQFIEEGFSDAEALILARSYLHGLAGGKHE